MRRSVRFFRQARFTGYGGQHSRWGRRVTTISAVVALTAVGVVQVTSQSPANDKPLNIPDPSTFPKIPSRAEQLTALKNPSQRFDVLIVGGGASGAGCALDAASRGLKVALVERDDFACGTSSRSTKLVHGGVRYLEKAFRVQPLNTMLTSRNWITDNINWSRRLYMRERRSLRSHLI